METFKLLHEEGADSAALDKVHVPIGLDIGTKTPEEIAVSILSEILAVKNGATGRSLSEERRESLKK